MADEITLDDLKRKQEALVSRIEALQNETDIAVIQQAATELQAEGEELEKLAKAFQEQELERNGAGRRGNTEVVLTKAQRERIEEQTGVSMESLFIKDDAGIATKTMPMTDPRIIEYRALQEAKRKKLAAESDEILRAQLVDVFAAIESASPAAAEKLEELKADPSFLCGLLQKK